MAFFYMFLLILFVSKSYSSHRTFSLTSLCQVRKPHAYVDRFDLDQPPYTIELHDSPSMSSILIEHVWTNSSYKQFRHCEFKVKTRSKRLNGPSTGLILAIRELELRRNLVGECVDYLIFEINDINPTSHKICGTVLGEYDMHDLRNYFEIPDGYIKIIVHIDNQNWGYYQMQIKLTITAYEDCSEGYQLVCAPLKCISKSLYDDSIINCFPPYCADEPSLNKECEPKKTYQETTHHILAISSAFVLIIFGISMAWYFFKIMYNYDRRFEATQRNIRQRQAATPSVRFETVYVPSTNIETLAETAETQSNAEEPPSYDSLYS